VKVLCKYFTWKKWIIGIILFIIQSNSINKKNAMSYTSISLSILNNKYNNKNFLLLLQNLIHNVKIQYKYFNLFCGILQITFMVFLHFSIEYLFISRYNVDFFICLKHLYINWRYQNCLLISWIRPNYHKKN
jgi:hypothetical protein